MSIVVTCTCGAQLEAASADSLLDDAYQHIEESHQNVPESINQTSVVDLMRSATNA
ncbi:MAG: hypothetical protein Q8M73_12725 [Actinomycetota bacterium]|nr:hypothetical protein [Actinomycetota bacterium]